MAAPCSDGREWRGDTGAESDVYECLFRTWTGDVYESVEQLDIRVGSSHILNQTF